MQEEALFDLVKKVQRTKAEGQTIELKAAHIGTPKRLFDTLSSFSNQDSGGIILFGIDESADFATVGVYDAQDLQKKVTEQCNQMEPAVRALFTVCEIGGKVIVSAEIPAVEISERPCFYKGVGRIKGSYVRVGDADELMSEYEIYSYDAFRKRIHDDLRTVPNAKITLFDSDRLDDYKRAVKKERENLAQNVSEDELLQLMGVMDGDTPTLAGVMVFSKYPQAYFPQFSITAVVIPGTEIGQTGTDDERFIDNKRITGAISDMLEAAESFVARNSRTKTIIDEKGKRSDIPEYPAKAVREAILNALVHRDYSIHTENIPVRIEMYRDRMEIKSPGGLYGKISIDSLGKVRPDTRNATLANMLELLHVTENRYSGIPTIRREFENAGLPAPVFEVRRGDFIVTFKNNIWRAEKKSDGNLEEAVLDFCATPRTRAELEHFTGFSRYYMMKEIITPLLDCGKLKMTIPDKPKSKNQKYVRA